MAGIRLTITGDREALLRLKHLQGLGMSRAMYRAMSESIGKVDRRVQLNLSGRVLKVKNDRLRTSIHEQIAPDGTWGKIGTNVEYAPIHEYGGVTKPHEIAARFFKFLRFPSRSFIGPLRYTARGNLTRRQTPGSVVFRKKVQHPGSVMPARPYMRPALQESLPEIRSIFERELNRALDGA